MPSQTKQTIGPAKWPLHESHHLTSVYSLTVERENRTLASNALRKLRLLIFIPVLSFSFGQWNIHYVLEFSFFIEIRFFEIGIV